MLFKKPEKDHKALKQKQTKILNYRSFCRKRNIPQTLFSSGATTEKLPPGQAQRLDTPSPPQCPGAEPRSPPAHPLLPCWCQSVPLSRCPVPGARRGGKAGRSRGSSLNSMASVHYYTVRIFIWTAKLKTDFCQNCRSHKNDDTGWGLFLF